MVRLMISLAGLALALPACAKASIAEMVSSPQHSQGTGHTVPAPAQPAMAQAAMAQAPMTPATSAPALTARLAHDPAKDTTHVSSSLGIIDVAASAPTDAFLAVEVVVQALNPDGTTRALRVVRMHRTTDGGVDRFRARVMAERSTFSYRLVGFAPDGRDETPVHEVRVAPVPHTPDWAKGAVWYQIFPERFRNGNPLNDPKGRGVYLAAWNANWYAIQPGELEAWKARRNLAPESVVPPRAGGPLYHVIFDRRYGGDLQGVVEKMDELQALGVTAIYLNPIFEAESLHKYDASDYRHIDERLAKPAEAGPARAQDGTYTPPPSPTGSNAETDKPETWAWTPADRYFVDVFLPEAKKRGLRVVLDGVWNHTGRQFWAFQDIVRNGRKSPYADWYICEFDDAGKLSSWTGWPGRRNGELPEFRQVKGGLTRDRDETVERGDLNQGVKEHIFAVTKRWMDPNNDGDPSDGIDGWRLDVAGEIGEQFWRDWRRLVKGINPDAIIIAEIWSKVDGLGGDSGFDTQMNYPFAYPVLAWLSNMRPRENWRTAPLPFSSTQLGEALTQAFKDAPQTNLIHQNLFASHDTPRYVSMLQNPGRQYDRDAEMHNGHGEPRKDDPDYIPFNESLPDDETYRLSLLGVAVQATYTGSPMIYYGDEWGMWGADDPNDRKPVPWSDKGVNQNADDKLMPEVRAAYERWLRLRQDDRLGAILRWGDVRHIDSGSPDVFAFARSLNAEQVVVVVNRATTPFDALSLLRNEGWSAQANDKPVTSVGPVDAQVWWMLKQ